MEFDEATLDVIDTVSHTQHLFLSTFEKMMRFEMECRYIQCGQRNTIVQYLYKLLIQDGKKESSRTQIPYETYGRVISECLTDKNNKIAM